MADSFPELRPAARILLGPGPSNVNPRVMKAMVSPVVGHLDPDFLKVMENIKRLLRIVFRTENEITFPVSGTGSAGMETVMANLIEDGDEVVVGVNGAFGTRMAEVASRQGAKVHKVEADWGTIVEPAKVAAALKAAKNPKLVAVVHAETSTGVHQPIEEIAELAHQHGAMIAIDAVTSLGCVPVEIDKWGIDACYSCTQKGIGAPPGLSPVTFSERAMESVRKRKTK
ncbi:pyridoxal-phosphate-dependent aminotransferase family protein, partial [Candidatus Binatus sp.]|uniref:pyridoxal-phosphate-dependent aminotransferase family protein n=1 Tax=Candidatus Binatus sp. TaxID=2811406 RepID=UPI003BAFB83C